MPAWRALDLGQARSLLTHAEELTAKGDGLAERLGLGACAQPE